MPKERSLPVGFAKRTAAPKWHKALIDLTWSLVRKIRACPGGHGFVESDFLCLYRFLLEYGTKKSDPKYIPWRHVVQAVAYVTANSCVPVPKPHQMRDIERLLRKIDRWKAENLHATHLTELLPGQKALAKRAWVSQVISDRDSRQIEKALKAATWAPERLNQRKRPRNS